MLNKSNIIKKKHSDDIRNKKDDVSNTFHNSTYLPY
ncbi:Uncharacterised protein [Myroides odoratimimus]|nr:Uncharacterised protein [Myroides odoratimimus]